MGDVHLMVFHIGPVQDFIVSARRSRDLWFGSWLLSDLSKTAALEIVEQNKKDAPWSLIFPAPDETEDLLGDFNVANRIVARTHKDPRMLGEAVRTRVKNRLLEIRDQTFNRILKEAPFKVGTANAQVEDLLELFWVSCPLNDNYPQARLKAEALMAARKVTREFAPSSWGMFADKSSLDGHRESVIPREAYSKKNQKYLRTRYGVRKGEHLCGVGMLKRHGLRGSGDDFYSTSHVAAQPFLRLLTEQHLTAITEFKQSLKDLGMRESDLHTVADSHTVFGRTDGHLLFSERLAEFFEDEEPLKKAQEALNKLIQKVHRSGPPPYYALIHADGDHMGKAISAQNSIEKHRALSKAATMFAQKAAVTVKRFQGSLIYAGGDDVLAMLPLDTVLECCRESNGIFADHMHDYTFWDEETSTHRFPTLSVGIAIVHHLEPLSDALTLVREAEKSAKNVEGKNALAITLCKRSGSDQTVAGSWGTLDERLQQFVELHRQREIPKGLAYELRATAQALGESDHSSLKEIMSLEVKRILKRKRADKGTKDITPQTINLLMGYAQTGLSLNQLADELIIAGELALVPQVKEVTT